MANKFYNNLISHWLMNDDEANTDVLDNKGSNDGVMNVNTDTKSVAGKINKALDFDGTNDYVEIPDSADFDVGGKLTVCAWVYSNGAWSGDAIILHDISEYKWMIYASGTPASKVILYIKTASGLIGTSYNTNDLNDGKWHFVVGVYDKTLESQRLKVYIDGVLDQTADGYNEDILDGDQGVHIATSYSGLTNGLQAKVDDVRIYNTAITPYYVKLLYNNGAGTEDENVQSNTLLLGCNF